MRVCRVVFLFALSISVAGLLVPLEVAAQTQPSGEPAKAGISQSSTNAKTPASSLGVFVYPQNDQNAPQQQRDETECYGWAREQTGFDPAAPAQSSSKPQAQAPKGGALKGAAGGAVAGTAIGAVAGDTGQGAAVGATAGAIRGRRAQKKAEKQTEKQAKADAQAAQQQQVGKFRNAFSACMDARHYSVK